MATVSTINVTIRYRLIRSTNKAGVARIRLVAVFACGRSHWSYTVVSGPLNDCIMNRINLFIDSMSNPES
jgi:hypothetical protein